MTTLRQAAQAALEALGESVPTGGVTLLAFYKAMNELRAALAEPQPEPVGHVHREGRRADGNPWMAAYFKQDGTNDLPEGTPLYTAPQAQQPLTDEQIIELWLPINRDAPHASNGALQIARAIERAHKIGVKL